MRTAAAGAKPASRRRAIHRQSGAGTEVTEGEPPQFRIKITFTLLLLQNRNRLTALETAIQFMPVSDPILAKLPTEVDLAALVDADKIEQAGLIIFQLDADVGEFFHKSLQAGHDGVELSAQGVPVVPRELSGQLLMKAAGIAMRADDVGGDPAD
jgi:hypothetical protein